MPVGLRRRAPWLAGQRDRKVEIVREGEIGRTALNEVVTGEQVLCEAWAKRTDLSDMEALEAGYEGSVRRARFVVPSTAKTRTVTGNDRLRCDGKLWNITGVKEVDAALRPGIEITAIVPSEEAP